jgi:N-dimethylarginine dimethylaminohydrolase
MLRVLIKPTTYVITAMQDKQNPYIDITFNVHKKKELHQHKEVEKAFSNTITYIIEKPQHTLPDIVFIANGGLSLPRLPKPTILLPNMKYKQRQEELEYLKGIYKNLHLRMIPFPGTEPFEGQAELKWFYNGRKAICGYGHRSTKETFEIIEKLFNKLYLENQLAPPELLVLPLESADYYHLDVAMLEFDDSKCVVHKKAFSEDSINKIKKFLGKDNVHVISTNDKMCLNAVVDSNKLITHKITDLYIKSFLERITNKEIIEVDTTEFEISGGSVRCMTLDLFR